MTATATGSASTRSPERTAAANDRAAAAFLRDNPGAGAPVVVLIPAFNEAASVAGVVGKVPDAFGGLAAEVIVVDDGSADATAAEAEAAGALVARLGTNGGQGNAFRLGYRLASERGARFVATADADGQFDPEELRHLVDEVVSGRADLVTGSRRLGAAHTDDAVRALGVVVFGRMISVLTGVRITDPANGLRAMSTEVAAAVDLRQAQYQSSELLISAIAHGFEVTELPVTMRRRHSGSSKKGGNLAYGYRFARVVLTTWWRHRPVARASGAARRGLW